ncbi:MAG: hypothetical protein KGH98_01720 [Candidatus Micrarchaeota archaeon]|nr:hypothetical protein [Candidatus Micrarchaeota archaeon]
MKQKPSGAREKISVLNEAIVTLSANRADLYTGLVRKEGLKKALVHSTIELYHKAQKYNRIYQRFSFRYGSMEGPHERAYDKARNLTRERAVLAASITHAAIRLGIPVTPLYVSDRMGMYAPDVRKVFTHMENGLSLGTVIPFPHEYVVFYSELLGIGDERTRRALTLLRGLEKSDGRFSAMNINNVVLAATSIVLVGTGTGRLDLCYSMGVSEGSVRAAQQVFTNFGITALLQKV